MGGGEEEVRYKPGDGESTVGKEEDEKVGLILNIQENKIMASGPITSWKIDGKTVTDCFGGLENRCRW